MKDDKFLTEKEKARKQKIDELTVKLESEGYKRYDKTISIFWANVISIGILVGWLAVFVLLWNINNDFMGFFTYPTWQLVTCYVSFFISIPVHELIHGVTWGMVTENGRKSIEYGFMKKTLTPYCNCSEPLSKGKYILGGIMPFIILGVLPSIIGLILGNLLLIIFGSIAVSGATGDLMIIAKILKYKSIGKDTIILDHPIDAGFIIYEK